MRTRLAVAAVAIVALLGACSSPADTDAATQPSPTGAGPTIDPNDTGGEHDHGSHGGFGGGKESGKDGARSDGDGGGSQPDAGGDDSGDGSDGAADGAGDGSAGGDGGGGGEGTAEAAYPASGTYVYSQKGTESFCDPSGSCERYDLPRTQRIATSYGQRTQTEAIVITEVESNGRYVRTTMHFTPQAGFVNEVYYRLTYEGLTLQERYNPDPPVPQLRFPLRTGRVWKASWEAGTSGDYRASVTGIERMDVGGRTIDAFRIETTTSFRGDLDGKASIVTWIDPATRALVATNGALNVRASYGSYNTTFQTTLRSAPGY
jgi:hypothetical protein